MMWFYICLVYLILNLSLFYGLGFSIKKSRKKMIAILFAIALTIPTAILTALHILLKRLFD